MAGIYDFTVEDIAGKKVKLDRYKGKVMLVVNTASECGFTPQYQGLEKLYKQFHGKGLEVLGFPCNQFGEQEPGSEKEIASFCERNYGVTFPLFRKIDVNGDDAAPVYKWLKKEKPGLLGLRGHQVELHQVPRRPEGQGRCALRAERHARVDAVRHREAAVIRALARRARRACGLWSAAALAQPDMNKVLRVSFPTAETGFDPQAAGDVYSNCGESRHLRLPVQIRSPGATR